MKSLFRPLGYAILFTVLMAVVGYSVLLWQTERWIERVRTAGADQFSISHGLARFGLDGVLHIADLRFTDYRLQEPVIVERLSVHFDSLLDAVTFAVSDLIDDTSLPTALTFEITNGSLPVTAEWSVLDPGLLPTASEPWVDFACGDVRPFEQTTFKQLGFARLRVDGKLHYEFITAERVLAILGELRLVGFQTVGISASALLSHDLSWPPPDNTEPPRLQHLQLNFTDLGFWQRYAQLCQGEVGLASQDFWKRSLTQTKARLGKAGIAIGGPFWSVLPEYLLGNAPLDLQLHPRRDFDPALLPFLSFRDQLARLGFQLQITGARMTAADLKVESGQLADFITPPPPPKPVPRVVRPPQDLEIPLSAMALAAEFTGKQIEVQRKTGATLQGRLLEVSARRLTLMTQINGGEVLYHLQRSELDRVTVRSLPADIRDLFQKKLELKAVEIQAPDSTEAAVSDIDADTEADDRDDSGEDVSEKTDNSALKPSDGDSSGLNSAQQDQLDVYDE